MEKKLLVVQIRSGIGNQLFQFAAGLYFASKYDFQLAFSAANYPSKFKGFLKKLVGQEKREFSLFAMLEQSFPLLSNREVERLVKTGSLTRFSDDTGHQENLMRALKTHKGIFLTGYWQQSNFVLSNLVKLKSLIAPQFNLSEAFKSYRTTLTDDHVAIHIRRGDFLTNKAFGACTISYYNEAIERIKGIISSPKFVVVTNDPDWASSNIKGITFSIFRSGTPKFRDAEEFFMLTAFRNLVISNSTFSWWTAVLGEHSSKQIICPARWFLKDALQAQVQRLFLPEWVILQNDLETN